jgi:hypothetical protein
VERREPTVTADDQALRSALRAFAGERPRWGYREAHHRLRREGCSQHAACCTIRA